MTEHGMFPSVMKASDDVPSSAFTRGDGDKMVEHGIFPSTIAAYDDELRDLCTHIDGGDELGFSLQPQLGVVLGQTSMVALIQIWTS
jgi:hypothetical protein